MRAVSGTFDSCGSQITPFKMACQSHTAVWGNLAKWTVVFRTGLDLVLKNRVRVNKISLSPIFKKKNQDIPVISEFSNGSSNRQKKPNCTACVATIRRAH